MALQRSGGRILESCDISFENTLSVLKAWVGEMSRAPSVSTETLHTAQCHVTAVSSTRGTVICLRLTLEKDWL